MSYNHHILKTAYFKKYSVKVKKRNFENHSSYFVKTLYV